MVHEEFSVATCCNNVFCRGVYMHHKDTAIWSRTKLLSQLGHVVKNQTQYQRVIKYFRCGQTVKTFLQINFLTLHSLSCDYSIYGSDTSLSGNHFISHTHLGKYL